jgi:hypothetical protein
MDKIVRYSWLVISLLLAGTLVFAVNAAVLPVEFPLIMADFTVVGEENGDWAGYFSSPAGDVNGDGLYDFLVGAPFASLGDRKGKAYLILGKPQNQWPSSPMNLSIADASFIGCEKRGMTARQLYTAGDVNGDGYDDMLISGWKCGDESTGKAYLVLGRPEADWGADFPLEDSADASFLGEHVGDNASYYSSTAGDVNGDGFSDFLISATQNDEAAENAGQVYLILGKENPDWGRDFNLADSDASFIGEGQEDRIGRSASYIGDINGDGLDDFMIGSISSDDGGIDAGESYLFLGRAEANWGMDRPVSDADASFVGENAYDESGRRIAAAGDVNGDGFGDFLIGASKNSDYRPQAGKTYLFLGNPAANWGQNVSLAEADAIFIGESGRDQAGRRVSGAGDPNHDGYDDFLIGAPHSNRNGEKAGAAYLIYGKPNPDWGNNFILSNADIAFLGNPDVGVAGYDVAWVGDFDGDLFDDFLVAAYGGRNNTTVPGEAYLILGNDLPDLVVTFPEDGSTAGITQSILFEGHASDPTDGDITHRILWISDLDGEIGEGGSIASTLSEGTHTVTATVIDSGGIEIRDQRTIHVLANFPPEISILNPDHKSIFSTGDRIDFSGIAQDGEDGDLSQQIIWTSDLAGEIGGGSTFETSLSEGIHTITATVIDSGGLEASAQIKIQVLANNPPEISILNPPHQSIFRAGDSIVFSGTALDGEDGDLSDQIIWTSNLDGEIGQGSEFINSDLSAGKHKIIASVQDSEGAVSTTKIAILIR